MLGAKVTDVLILNQEIAIMFPKNPSDTTPNLNLINITSPVSPSTQTSQTPTRTNTTDSDASEPMLRNREATESPWDDDEVSADQSVTAMPSNRPEVKDAARQVAAGQLNTEDSFQAIRGAACLGDAIAQFRLGQRYDQGKNVKQDSFEAFFWYKRAAEQADAYAQFNVEVMYQDGDGVKRNAAKAVFWFLKAAEQGDADAQKALGEIYDEGCGVKKDVARAFFWYLKAAEKGDAQAQFNVGQMYEDGDGVEADAVLAVFWYRKSAEQAYAEAQCNLASMYARGEGVETDSGEAFNWFYKAANNGSKYAQLSLASVYQQGLGVKKDILQAAYWLLRSGLSALSIEINFNDDIFNEKFFSDVIQYIPEALTKFPEFYLIKAIDFSNIPLSVEAFFSIGKMIRSNPSLEILDFDEQEIDNGVALVIAQSLNFNTTLIELNFDEDYEYFEVDENILGLIKASLVQNVIIAELREYMKRHPASRSDHLPLEVMNIVIDQLIVSSIKGGQSKDATKAAMDEFLLSASRETLEADVKKSV